MLDEEMKEEARDLAARVGTHPDLAELQDHCEELEKYPAMVQFFCGDGDSDNESVDESWIAEQFTTKVIDWILADVHDVDLPARVFRFKHRLDLKVKTKGGSPAIERRWSNNAETLINGGYDERRIITGPECAEVEQAGVVGKIFIARWAWDCKGYYPKADRPFSEIKNEIIRLAERIIEKVNNDNFTEMNDVFEEFERVVHVGMHENCAAEWEKIREKAIAARQSASR